MSISGGWKKLTPSNAGENGVILSGDAYDALVAAINNLAAMEIAPMSNCGRFVMNEGQTKLDLMDIDNRLRALESRPNITTANAVCVGNVVTFTFG